MNEKVDWFRCSLPDDPASGVVLRHLRELGLLCADHGLRQNGRLTTIMSSAEIAAVKASGIKVKSVSKLALGARAPVGALDFATGFVGAYLDSQGIHAAYAALQSAFPALCTLSDLPEATTGYDGSVAALAGSSPVKLFRITSTPAITANPAMLVVAGLHAREWAPPLAALEFASQLLNNYSPGSPDPEVAEVNAIVDGLDTLIMVAANPDGINFSHHDQNMWRKNRRPNAGALLCPGVDLNRNFSIFWGQGGSSPDPCSEVHRGPNQLSEAETRNIRFLTEQFPNLLTAIDCHSFGEDIFRPQITGGSFIGAEPVNAADDAIYSALESAINAGITSVTPGKTYSTGTTSNHSGTFDEYMFFAHRIFGLELEIGQDFQPPIADALVSAREGAAAMRHLAGETLNMSARFVTPVAIAHVIDRSGSMVGSGYVEATRAHARRMIDLMSLNDTIAVASFASSASTDFPATEINSPATYAAARAAVGAIAFGGGTSIGAGLERGLTLLPAPGNPRAIVLLSDGYENTPPMVSSILSAMPADVAVHTIALGPASDQLLLQQIAVDTGGSYHFAPDELALFEIYNAVHAASTNTDIVMSEWVGSPGSAAKENVVRRRFVIDCDADFAEISVMSTSQRHLDCSLRCLSLADCDLSRVQTVKSGAHRALHWRRPQPGTYELSMRGSGIGGVAVFVRSPVRAKLILPDAQRVKNVAKWGVSIESWGKPLHDLSLRMQAWVPGKSPKPTTSKVSAEFSRLFANDPLPELVMAAVAQAQTLRKRSGRDPATPVPVIPQIRRADKVWGNRASFAACVPIAPTVTGSVNIRIEIDGRTPSGCAFSRTIIGSRCVSGQ